MASISVELSSSDDETSSAIPEPAPKSPPITTHDGSPRTSELRVIVESDAPIDFNTLRIASDGRPLPKDVRAKAWLVLLGIANRTGDSLTEFDELYNLPQQSAIREQCNTVFDSLGNDESDRRSLTSQLECVITFMCKQLDVVFDTANGWTDVLQLLCVLQYDKVRMYNAFHAIVTKYIPRGCEKDGKPFDLFRLLLLYHEPELCSFLDTRKVTPHDYASKWFTTIFSSVCSVECALPLWDVYLQQGDPFSVFFMSLVMLMNAKDTVMTMGNDREGIIETLAQVPSQLGVDDIEDFCQLANYYAARTPQSFRRDYHGPLFGSNLASAEFADWTVHSLLCLPVSVQELLSAAKVVDSDAVDYFVVDARPTIMYANGHLPGAFNLDASLMVDSPPDYGTALHALIEYKARVHPLAHVCFMGEGDADADTHVHMAVSQWLQRGNSHVSLARGGYAALHDVLRETLSTRLQAHSVRNCSVCNQQAAAHSPQHTPSSLLSSPIRRAYAEGQSALNTSSSLVSRFKNSLASAKLVDRVMDYVVNPNGEQGAAQKPKKGDKSYRNLSSSVFTLDDSDGEVEDDDVEPTSPRASSSSAMDRANVLLGGNDQPALINLKAWADDNDIPEAHVFAAQFVHPETKILAHCTACVSATHLYILSPYTPPPTDKSTASTPSPTRNVKDEPVPTHSVFGKRPLATVHKITSKKSLPELITIKYGYEMNGGEFKITRVDKLLVPKAGDLAKAIKTNIVALKDDDDV